MNALLDVPVWEGLSEEVTIEQRPGYRRKQSRIMPRRITGKGRKPWYHTQICPFCPPLFSLFP